MDHNIDASKFFYYLQDVMLDMLAAYQLLKDLETIESEVYNLEDLTYLSPQLLKDSACEMTKIRVDPIKRISINTLIIGICRISEAIKAKGYSAFFRGCAPKFQEYLHKFSSLYYTEEVRLYRNQYAAHPIDDKSKDFLPRKDISITLSDALNSITYYKDTEHDKIWLEKIIERDVIKKMSNIQIEMTVRAIKKHLGKEFSEDEMQSIIEQKMDTEKSKLSNYICNIFQEDTPKGMVSFQKMLDTLKAELTCNEINIGRN